MGPPSDLIPHGERHWRAQPGLGLAFGQLLYSRFLPPSAEDLGVGHRDPARMDHVQLWISTFIANYLFCYFPAKQIVLIVVEHNLPSFLNF